MTISSHTSGSRALIGRGPDRLTQVSNFNILSLSFFLNGIYICVQWWGSAGGQAGVRIGGVGGEGRAIEEPYCLNNWVCRHISEK